MNLLTILGIIALGLIAIVVLTYWGAPFGYEDNDKGFMYGKENETKAQKEHRP